MFGSHGVSQSAENGTVLATEPVLVRQKTMQLITTRTDACC